MLDFLPDLSGQPAWVVIVVVTLLVIGSVGSKWITRGGREIEEGGEDGQEEDRPALHAPSPGSDAQTTLVLTKALDLLANEAVESRDSRAEAERLRDELLTCSRERDRVARQLADVQADLEKCNADCRALALRALEREGNPGVDREQ